MEDCEHKRCEDQQFTPTHPLPLQRFSFYPVWLAINLYFHLWFHGSLAVQSETQPTNPIPKDHPSDKHSSTGFLRDNTLAKFLTGDNTLNNSRHLLFRFSNNESNVVFIKYLAVIF